MRQHKKKRQLVLKMIAAKQKIFARRSILVECPVRYPNFDVMRLFLAGEVAFVHAWFLVDPNFGWDGWIMAVPAFLAISGFLVLQSYEQTPTWLQFVRKRALRLLPALAVSFLLTFAMFGWPTTYNSILNWITGGIYTLPYKANGPLWSLAWEELAYLSLALLWWVGCYKRPIYLWVLLIISLIIVWRTTTYDPHTRIILFLPPSFLIGNLMYIYRHTLLRVPSLIPWVALYAVIQFRYSPQSQILGGAPLLCAQAFVVVWVSIAGSKLLSLRIPDISYGVYIYHMLFIMWLSERYEITSLGQILIYTSVLLIPFSLLSWYVVEKPALKLRKIFD
jgi:peptidoglycan/LPS O-acetylase OafA/YrhL